jgi:serine/threonine protein kinase
LVTGLFLGSKSMNERSVFLSALEIDDPECRAAYLREACGADAGLRRGVEELLQANDSAGSFMNKPAATFDPIASDTAAGDDASVTFLAPSDQPGSLGRLANYEITRVIGRGGMGIVLEGRDTRLERVVAVKVLVPQLAVAAAARERFLREARAAAAVRDEQVVTIYAVEEEQGLPYLVMELINGMSLQERIDRDGPLELKEILRIGIQAARGLAAAHSHGLIHRDVKPANILLENGVERVKLTDFGLARVVDDASITQSGVIAGTPQYMAPEQAKGEAVDTLADLFSLGSVLYAMCTGRPPFRATTTLGVLKRVCEDRLGPLREINPSIPDWLVALIEKLHAKNPAERCQSAAEVADILSQHLAQLQHPSLDACNAPLVKSQIPNRGARDSGSSQIRGRRAIAAAMLLSLALGLGLAATVIRIFTPSGTLVVETNDPGVKVTVEGDGGLIITGAGLEEIRLRPGNYRVHADKGGQRVPLDREMVSISRGGREIVRVKLEGPPTQTIANAKKGEFVLLAEGKERKFDTLAEAVEASSDGDTIEVRGDGPFVTSPITSGNQGLTLRAAAGFRPIVQFSRDSGSHQSRLFASTASLTLEGLEFRGPPPGPNDNPVAFDAGISLHAANCRFDLPQAICVMSGGDSTRRCVLRNCEFLSSVSITALAGGLAPGGNWLVDNCVQLRGNALSFHWCSPDHDNCSLQLTRCTCVGSADWDFPIGLPGTRKLGPGQTPKAVQLSVSGCVLDCNYVLGVNQEKPSSENDQSLAPQDFETLLQELLEWRGGQNVYRVRSGPADGQSRLLRTGMGDVGDPPHGPTDLATWREFWRSPETGSLEGRVRYEGGNLIAKVQKAPHQITPEDFRLRSDSAGYRAGPDGKDLGADVDLVGPGPAYERWKKTPEYQDWLKETGQMK